MRVVDAPGYREARDALAQDWGRFLEVAVPESIWLPIPNLGPVRSGAFCESWDVNALILSGGQDLGECRNRDETELSLLSWASERELPVLGICRGMQLMGAWAGAALRPVQGHVATRHAVHGHVNTEVNSYHNVALATCPEGFEPIAWAPDEELEAMRHTRLPWEAWMWHPEREPAFQATDVRRMRTIFA